MNNTVSANNSDRVGLFILAAPLIAVTFLGRFALPLGGENQVALAALIICGITVLGFMSSRLRISAGRLAFYLITMGVLVLTHLLGDKNGSLLSLIMIIIMHLPYVFFVRNDSYAPGQEVKIFTSVVVILSFFGISQFFFQYISYDIAFFFSTIFPQEFILTGYNSLNAVRYGGEVFKSNGFFLNEPSTFSQLLAIALVLQLILLRSFWKSALFIMALALTFSGTGLLMLFSILPLYLLYKKKFILILLASIAIFSAPVWAPVVGLENTVARSQEVSRQGSSGYARFVAPSLLIEKMFHDDNQTIIFGYGAGSVLEAIGGMDDDFEIHNPSWSKVIYEYGLLGSIVYFLFMGYIFLSSGKSLFLVGTITILFLFLGEYVFPPTAHGIILTLLAWSRSPRQANFFQLPESGALLNNPMTEGDNVIADYGQSKGA